MLTCSMTVMMTIELGKLEKESRTVDGVRAESRRKTEDTDTCAWMQEAGYQARRRPYRTLRQHDREAKDM